jgi:hypothetical protein
VRCAAIVWLSFLVVSTGFTQQQERTLIDRLLRPDMELQNKAQSKKFATNSTVIENRGTVGTFVLEPARQQKPVAETRTIVTTEYRARSFQSNSSVSSSVQNRDADLSGQLTTLSTRDIHETHDSHLKVADRSFAGEREFREQGKSQKSLDRQNPPLTIDQVRELLNRNK